MDTTIIGGMEGDMDKIYFVIHFRNKECSIQDEIRACRAFINNLMQFFH